MTKRLRTCTVMSFTDGTRSRYVVLRGPMAGPATFDAHAAEVVATYATGPGEEPDYIGWTAAHATDEAPAVSWQTRRNVNLMDALRRSIAKNSADPVTYVTGPSDRGTRD